jgi:hypothetical protein
MAKITNIAELLDAIEESVGKDKKISLGKILDCVGHRSYGPLLLLAGLVMAAPGIGDIPGIPTGMGIFTALVAGQMVIGRDYLWLPRWLLKRKISQETLCKAIGRLSKPARKVDRVIRPRLTALTYNSGRYGIALACFAIAMATPAMEVVLFSANAAGAALAAFGLSLVAHDGLLALIAYAFTLGAAAALLYALL